MALPPLTEEGELPLGVHRASLREVRERFGVGGPTVGFATASSLKLAATA